MIGVKLKEIRETTGMNKKEFAQYLGLKYTTYNGYETEAREPSSDFLILVSEKFDVSIDYLLGLKDEKQILHSYQLCADEVAHIKKYRDLDSLGQEHVQTVLEWETERMVALENEKENYEHSRDLDVQKQSTMYAKLKPEDRSALNQGIKLLRPQSLPPAKENFREPELEKLLEDEKKPASPPKDLSAFDPRDLAAVREAAKLLQPKKGHNWKNLDG